MRQYLQNFIKYQYLLQNLISRDIKVKYRRSILGLAWSILNPLLMMLVITAVFSEIFKFDIDNFPLYYLTGSIIFSFFTEATNSAMTSMLAAAPLIKKTYVPKYIFPLEKVLFAFVNLLFSLIAIIILFLFSDISLTKLTPLFPIPLFYVLVFSMGLGLILSSLSVFFRDMLHLYGVVNTAWMYFTPIFYPVTIIPDRLMFIMKGNPLYHYIDYFRQILLYGTLPGVQENLICMVSSGATLIIGLIVFKKQQDKFILYI